MTHQQNSQPPFEQLSDWLDWLENTRPEHEMELGLDRIRKVAERLDLLKPAPFVITVGGTNGKGSTVAILESILLAAGYKVGVYTSPHLLRFNERIKVNNVEASDEALCNSFEKVNEGLDGDWLSYFEFAVLLAVDVFQKEKIDIALMEVGLGGRLDATNVIEPDVSVITTVGLDHQDWLGYSIEAIAKEKAGIFRPEKPAVFGGVEIPNSIVEQAVRLESALYRRKKEFELREENSTWSWKGLAKTGEPLEYAYLPIPALVIDNATTALQAIQFLPEVVNRDAIVEGLKASSLPGRYEKVVEINQRGEKVEVILDVAHNPQAAGKLVERLKADPVPGKTRALIAIFKDKDYHGVIESLAEVVDEWVVTDFDSPRALGKDDLSEAVARYSELPDKAESTELGFQQLVEASTSRDRVLVVGSFLTVGAILISNGEALPSK
ncbi:bifunctional tetrahydrofolate synthase/dihydrofolate synthase [Endozoicomonas numazuensis]|uniref:bifunctional tetrahydrofolate synthase/dihydrofolate synthase n=1 Tax=Endozoicomonas numazuensis TaxID=1137799 RepID=UPI00068BCD05|nr:bifunctional tetrahydrofolate synthase/dihydrofolate synthase [Endozoicomonas numazuensis]